MAFGTWRLEAIGSPPQPLTVYVVLCYRECETDPVPIPGGPCRTQEDSTAASRITDDFQLKLVLEPPPQVEENAVRRFGASLVEQRTEAPGRWKPLMLPGLAQCTVSVPASVSTSAKKRL